MKVLMLTDYFYPHIGGGVEKVVYEVSKRLLAVGCEVVIMTLNTEDAPRVEKLDGLHIYRCSAVELTRSLGLQLSISIEAPLRMTEICRKENPDIIHANNSFFYTTICAAAMKEILKKPLLTTLHLGSAKRLGMLIDWYEKTIGKWIIDRSDMVVAVSKSVGDLAIKLGTSPSKVRVIENGVDTTEFRPKRKPGSDKEIRKIVTVGRLIKNKGVQYLVDAAPRILAKYPDTRFVVVGQGPMKKELEERVRRNRVEYAFDILGKVSNVADVLNDCDVFVRTSLSEGMPLTVLEAMACGLPVVATKIPGNVDLLNASGAGILIDTEDITQLSKSILYLIENPTSSVKLGEKGRHYVEKNHNNWDTVAGLTLKAYDDLLSKEL